MVGIWTQTFQVIFLGCATNYTTHVRLLRCQVSILGPCGYEPHALPLRHIALMQTVGFEPTRPKPLDLKANPLDLLGQVCLFIFFYCWKQYDLPRHQAHSIECRNGNRTHIRSLSRDCCLLYVSILLICWVYYKHILSLLNSLLRPNFARCEIWTRDPRLIRPML